MNKIYACAKAAAKGFGILMLVMVGMVGKSWGQVTIVNYDFNSGTNYATLVSNAVSGITSSVTSSEPFLTFGGTASGVSAFTTNTPGSALAMSNSSGTNTRYFDFGLTGSLLSIYKTFKLYFQAQRSGTGATTTMVQYSLNGGAYTSFAGNSSSTGNGTFAEATIILPTAVDNPTTSLAFRLLVSGGSGSSGTYRIDNFQIQAVAPVVTPPTKLAVMNITPASPTPGGSFSITVQSQDGSGNSQNVAAATAFTLTTNGNAGALGGTLTGTIAAGASSVVMSGLTLPNPGTSVNITATRTSGDNLTAGTSADFTVAAPPAVTYTWANGSCAWLNAGAWAPSSYPGNTVGNTELAQFNTVSVSSGGTGINFSSTPVIFELGGIEVTNAYPGSTGFAVGNNSGSSDGSLQLNGTVINGVSNTILRNASSASITIKNNPGGACGGSRAMDVILGNATNNIVTIQGSGSIIMSAIVSGTTPLTKDGTGTGVFALTAANTYTGATVVNGGTLTTTTIANGGTASGIGASTNTATNFILGGGTFQYTGTTASTNRNFTLTNATTSSIDLTNNLTISGAAAATTGSFTKIGAGSLILTGANAYSGTTTVSAGKIQLNRTGGNTIPVGNSVNVGSGAVLQISQNQTLSNVTLSAGSTLTVDAGTTLTITGTLTVNVNAVVNGTGTVTYTGASSTLLYTGTGALTAGIEWPLNTNIVTIDLGSVITLNVSKTSLVTLNLNGTLKTLALQISGPGEVLNINGTLITENLFGLIGTNTTFNGTSPTLTLGSSSTIEYAAPAGTQVISTGPAYANLTTSVAGTKTIASGITIANNLTISGSVLLDAGGSAGVGGSTTNLIMTGSSTFRQGGAGIKPDASGTYSLGAGTTIEFAGISATQIRISSPVPNYYNVNVTGTNVSTSTTGASIGLQTGGTFTVAANAKFKTRNPFGFSGAANTAVSSNNNPLIVLDPASTIDYSEPIAQLITNQLAYGNLELSATSGTKTAPSGTLNIRGNFTRSGAAFFDPNAGIVLFNGTTAQGIYVTGAAVDFYNLTTTNTTGLTVYNNININRKLSITGGAAFKLDAGDVTIKSTATNTAEIGTITGSVSYPGAGRFVIEKYIKTPRKWQLLSPDATVPTSGTVTFLSSWMENQSAVANNLGMWVTGVGGAPNFDAATSTPTIKYWNGINSGASYTGISSKNDNIHAYSAYMTFVRGDRGSTGANPTVLVPTVLRTRGEIHTGDYPAVAANATTVPAVDGLVAIGNPYASPIDLRLIRTDAIGQNLTFYVWDPQLTSSSVSTALGLGAYQTISGDQINGFTITPGGGSYSVGNGGSMNTIESGQAFFSQAPNSGFLKIQFYETSKGTFANTVSFSGTAPQILGGSLYAKNNGDDVLMDGFLVKYDNANSNAADNADSKKLINTNENISVKTGDKLLSVELRKPVDEFDTIHINMANMREKDYKWSFNMGNMDKPGRIAFLVDQFLGTSIVLDLANDNNYDFSVTSTPASSAADRFLIVFKPAVVLPVTFTTINAGRQKETAVISFKTATEINIHHYEIQSSNNGTTFTTIGNQNAVNNTGGSATYTYTDLQPGSGVVYYHIKAISLNGLVQYSKTVKIDPINGATAMVISPNPVKDKTIHLQMNNQTAGAYAAQLINNAGQVVFKTAFTVTSTSELKNISLNKTITAGTYTLSLQKTGEQAQVQQVIVL